MAPRIVVSLCLAAHEAGYLRRALAAKKRAEALGANLAAWAPDSFAFDFAPENVDEAVDLALATFDETKPLGPRFSAGMAFGELERVADVEALGKLAWGPPLSAAWQLARAAAPGDVWIDERCPAKLIDALRTLGERRVVSESLAALVLDTRHPFRRDTVIDALGEAESTVRVHVPPMPPIAGVARELLERPRAPQSERVEAAPSREEPPLETQDDAAPETLGTPAPGDDVALGSDEEVAPELLGELTIELDHAPSPEPAEKKDAAERRPSDPPPTVRTDPPAPAEAPVRVPVPPAAAVRAPLLELSLSDLDMPDEGAEEAEPSDRPTSVSVVAATPQALVPPPAVRASSDIPSSLPAIASDRISWPGASEEYAELTAAARQALLKGNVGELERLSDELKNRGEGDLADRMAGFVAWNRGAKAEGLRKLRAAADAETRPAYRVRALLAYGVALAASGRTDGALLAALGALARAREVEDRQGEHVCARFLARLSAAAGYERAARTWAEVARDVATHRPAE